MSDIATTVKVSQEAIYGIQDQLQRSNDVREGQYEHLFASGVYMRVLKVPEGCYAVGKAHRTEHITILLKGACSFTADDGTIVLLQAPHFNVTPPGKKKLVFCHTECWFANIHATETTDLVEIEKKVIIPEEEHLALLGVSKEELLVSAEE